MLEKAAAAATAAGARNEASEEKKAKTTTTCTETVGDGYQSADALALTLFPFHIHPHTAVIDSMSALNWRLSRCVIVVLGAPVLSVCRICFPSAIFLLPLHFYIRRG